MRTIRKAYFALLWQNPSEDCGQPGALIKIQDSNEQRCTRIVLKLREVRCI
jgi:hypothetical protein